MKKNKVKETVKLSLFVGLSTLLMSTPALAGSKGNLATGTTALVNSLSTWATGVVPTVGALAVAFEAIRKNLSGGNEAVIASANKHMKAIIMTTVIATVASGVIAWITSFYN